MGWIVNSRLSDLERRLDRCDNKISDLRKDNLEHRVENAKLSSKVRKLSDNIYKGERFRFIHNTEEMDAVCTGTRYSSCDESLILCFQGKIEGSVCTQEIKIPFENCAPFCK